MDGVKNMMQRPQRNECTWFDIRYALSEYYPSKLEEYDKLMEADDKRGALKIVQDTGLISRDSWVWFE